MPHPYQQHERTKLWRVIDDEFRSLEANGDIELTTARQHVIGALCQRLVVEGLGAARPSDPPAP